MRTTSENRTEKREESKQLISEIKRVCERLSWSQKELAEKIYLELNDDDNEKNIESFYFAFVKQLQRATTHPERLKEYLSIMSNLPEFKKSNLVLNKYTPLDHLSDFIQYEMLRISKDLDKKFHAIEIAKDSEK